MKSLYRFLNSCSGINMYAKLAIVSILMFIGFFYSPFLLVCFIITGLFIFFEHNINSLSYLLFFISFYSIWGFSNSYKITYWFLLFCVYLCINGILYIIKLIKKQEKIKWNIFLIIFLFALYLFLPINKTFQWKNSLETIIWLLFFYLIIVSVKDIDIKQQVLSLCFGFIVSSVFGLFRSLSPFLTNNIVLYSAGSKIRFSGCANNPNIFYSIGGISLISLFVLLMNNKINQLYFLLLIPILIFSWVSLSKAFLFSYVFILIGLFVVCLIKKNSIKWKNYIALLLLTMFVALMLFNYTKAYFSRLTDETIQSSISTITTGRWDIWKTYFNNLVENKAYFFGFGINTASNIPPSNTHNTYLQILYEIGIFGIVCLLGITVYYFVKTKKQVKNNISQGSYLPVIMLAGFYLVENLFLSQLGVCLLITSILCINILNGESGENLEDNKPKVLHLLSSQKFSGAENVVCQIIKMFEGKIDCLYCAVKGDIESSLIEQSIKYRLLETLNINEVSQVIKDFKPTIIHAHDYRASVLASKLKNVFPNLKIVSQIHCNKVKMRKPSLQSLYFLLFINNIDYFIWVSNVCYNDFYFKKLLKKRSCVLSNILDVKKVEQKAVLDKNTYKSDVVYVGRFVFDKNPERLIEIGKKLKERKPNFKMNIAGDGELKQNCEDLVKKYNLNKNIKFLGFVSNPYKLMKYSKLMIMTSRTEGLPMSALESLCLGTPIVSTNIEGLKGIIEQGKNGYFYETDEEAVDYILKALTNNKTMRQNCLDFSNKYNNIKKYTDCLQEIYKKIREK